MAISEKQLRANQKNAKLGGVKTAKGKEIVKYNAMKHGLLSKKVVIEGESKKEFNDFEKAILEDLNPKGALEEFWAGRLIANMWRFNRILKIESSLMDYYKNEVICGYGIEKQREREKYLKMIDNSSLENLIRYEKAIEHSLYNDSRHFRFKRNNEDLHFS